ncbi:uncharacterized protein GGS25DRAFT_524897 [Hypoxylon fragiforme]|uniref:uncharacterized protein n=1 Tax=Hypoxylon fragiforme TaxID=63214 RepID=UPI0020C61D88|nr:uncharacterized protein GGS25DRAFT_524897 [Hypoxylon fragiforme]KAI2605381.1 hypothetical protein GGS25DRAFT_524897 [Hypoxylon fragiforme]
MNLPLRAMRTTEKRPRTASSTITGTPYCSQNLESRVDNPQIGSGNSPSESSTCVAPDSTLMAPPMIAVVPETSAAFPMSSAMLDTDDFDDLGFVEDFLLPDTTMIPGYTNSMTCENESTLVPSSDGGGVGHFPSHSSMSALPAMTTSNIQEEPSEPSYLQVLSTSNCDIEEFRNVLY